MTAKKKRDLLRTYYHVKGKTFMADHHIKMVVVPPSVKEGDYPQEIIKYLKSNYVKYKTKL